MRIVSLRDAILWPGFSLMGFDPRVDLLTDLADFSARSINARVRKYWDVEDWYELSKIEPRTPVNHLVSYDAGVQPPPLWDNVTTFQINSIVRDPANLQNIYKSLVNANTNHPLSDGTRWLQIAAWDPTKLYVMGSQVSDSVSGIVYQAQTAIVPGSVLSDSLRNPLAWQPIFTQQQPSPNITSIGKILKVYKVDPTLSDGPFDIPFKEFDAAFHVGFRHGIQVWVKFMTRPSQYTFTVWNSNTVYNQYSTTNLVSDLAYNGLIGECFASLQPNNHNNALPTGPVSNGFWQYVPFPFVLADVVKLGFYADLLLDAGQVAKAQAIEQEVQAELQLTIARNTMTRYDRVTDQQTGTPRYNAMVAPTTS